MTSNDVIIQQVTNKDEDMEFRLKFGRIASIFIWIYMRTKQGNTNSMASVTVWMNIYFLFQSETTWTHFKTASNHWYVLLFY